MCIDHVVAKQHDRVTSTEMRSAGRSFGSEGYVERGIHCSLFRVESKSERGGRFRINELYARLDEASLDPAFVSIGLPDMVPGAAWD